MSKKAKKVEESKKSLRTHEHFSALMYLITYIASVLGEEATMAQEDFVLWVVEVDATEGESINVEVNLKDGEPIVLIDIKGWRSDRLVNSIVGYCATREIAWLTSDMV